MYKKLILLSTFLSGMTGLAYQIYWQKYSSFLVGSEARSIALVVSIFLLGLATGYEFWGRLTEKITDKHKLLKTYGYIEIGIGLYALVFPYYFEFLKTIVFGLGSNFLTDLVLTIVYLFLPTFLMGGTVPILTSYLPETEEEINDAHAKIYGINSLGAFIGVFVGTALIPELGLTLSMILTAIVNLLIGLIFISNKIQGTTKKQKNIPKVESNLSDRLVYGLVFTTGAVSLGLEVILVRAVGLSIGMSFIVFPMVLSLFILGLAGGSLTLQKSKDTSPRFLINQIGAAIIFMLVIFFTIPLWPTMISHIRVSLSDISSNYYVFYTIVYIFLGVAILPAVYSFGRLLPLGYSLLNKSGEDYGKKCGKLYFYNTLGTLIGSLCLGYFFLYLVDLDTILRISIMMLIIVLATVMYKQNNFTKKMTTLLVIATLSLFHTWNRLDLQGGVSGVRKARPSHFKGLFSKVNENIKPALYYNDGPNATVTVMKGSVGHAVLTNGKPEGHSGSIHDVQTMGMAAILPYVFSSSEKNLEVALVGQGLGITAGLFGVMEDVDKVEMLEISDKVLETLPIFKNENWNAYKNPKIKQRNIDAFKFFANNNNKSRFDIVSSEPSNPWVVGIENLFTQEFYQLAKRAMKKNGIFMQWIHRYSSDKMMVSTVFKNLSEEFKYIEAYYGGSLDILIVASNEPLDRTYGKSRLNEPLVEREVRRYLPTASYESIDYLNIFKKSSIDAIAKINSVLEHNLYSPKLNVYSLRPFFAGNTLELKDIVNPVIARYLNDQGLATRGQARTNLKEDIEKLCRIQKGEVSTFCMIEQALRESLYAIDQKYKGVDWLMHYARVRDSGFYAKNIKALDDASLVIIKTRNDNAFKSIIEEYLKDNEFERAKGLVLKIKNEFGYNASRAKLLIDHILIQEKAFHIMKSATQSPE